MRDVIREITTHLDSDTIHVGIDNKGHLWFFCPVCDEDGLCDNPLQITHIDTLKGAKYVCSKIHLLCPTHGHIGAKKLYHAPVDDYRGPLHSLCDYRTDILNYSINNPPPFPGSPASES